MRALVVLACALAFAACVYPDKQFDGPYSCVGAPPPTTANPLVKLGGTAVDPSNLSPLAGVSIDVEDAQMNTIFGPNTTDASGAFSFSMNTNGTPVDSIELHATAANHATIYFYAPRPITQDLATKLAMLSSLEQASLAADAGLTFNTADGNMLLTINDCNDAPIAGATVSSTPAGAVRYFDGVMPSPTATATDAGGVVLIANLPTTGKVTVTATAGGMQLPPRSFTVVANTFIETSIVP